MQRGLPLAAACLTAVALIASFIWFLQTQATVNAREEQFVGSVIGAKFNDLNNDGTWDAASEPGLPGWTIQAEGGGMVITAVTGIDGKYVLNLPAGNYLVGEVQQAGWTQTFPAAPNQIYQLVVADNQTIANIDFGNWRLPVGTNALHGMKFNDLNGDGIHDANEPGLPNWTINLNGPNGQPVSTTVTNSDGMYWFMGLPDGAYVLSEVQQAGWVQTAPVPSTGGAGVHFVQVAGGQTIDGLDFGNRQANGGGASIHGHKFNDMNGNGIHDPNEMGMGGWTILLQYQGVTTTTTTTNAQGAFWFMGLPAGTYTLTEVQQTGWVQTAPAAGFFTVTVTDTQTVDGLEFGNTVPNPGEIHGLKFNDLNGDGVHDANEPVLPNWTITLHGPNNQVQTAVTDANGEYWFMGLPAGSYIVAEVVPPPTWNGQTMDQWMQTAPSSGTFSVTLGSGQVVSGLEFGNWQGGDKDDYCMIPWDNHFLNTTSMETQVYIFNDSPDPNKAYTMQLIGPSTMYVVTPTLPIILNPNEFGVITIHIDYPTIFNGPSQNSSFQAIVTNMLTGQSFTCTAALWSYSPSWWVSGNVNSGIAGGIPVGFTQAVGFLVQNTPPGPGFALQGGATMSYTISAMSRGFNNGASPLVSLNGLAPGAMIEGSVAFSGTTTQTVSVDVAFVGYVPGAWTDIVFEADFDQDGTTDAVTSYAIWADPYYAIYLPVGIRH